MCTLFTVELGGWGWLEGKATAYLSSVSYKLPISVPFLTHFISVCVSTLRSLVFAFSVQSSVLFMWFKNGVGCVVLLGILLWFWTLHVNILDIWLAGNVCKESKHPGHASKKTRVESEAFNTCYHHQVWQGSTNSRLPLVILSRSMMSTISSLNIFCFVI